MLNHDFGAAIEVNDTDAILTLTQLAVKFPIKQGLLNRVKDYVVAVEPLNLSLAQGQSIGIVGESGSGKTSLALAISLLIASEGEIVLLCTDLNQYNEKQLRPLRAEFQMVFQDPFSSLNPRLNVEQTIGEGLALKAYTQA